MKHYCLEQENCQLATCSWRPENIERELGPFIGPVCSLQSRHMNSIDIGPNFLSPLGEYREHLTMIHNCVWDTGCNSSVPRSFNFMEPPGVVMHSSSFGWRMRALWTGVEARIYCFMGQHSKKREGLWRHGDYSSHRSTCHRACRIHWIQNSTDNYASAVCCLQMWMIAVL